MAPHEVKLPLEALNSVADKPAVGFELALAGASGADAAAQPLEVSPLSRQPGQQVLVLGELDLEASLAGAGVATKDIQDHARAVEDLDLKDAFEVLLLRGPELVVEDDGFGFQLSDGFLELLEFAPAEVERPRLRPPLLDSAHNGGPCRVSQTAQLLHRVVEVPECEPRRRANADEDGPLGPGLRSVRGWLGYGPSSGGIFRLRSRFRPSSTRSSGVVREMRK